jgi:hypothetical protein
MLCRNACVRERVEQIGQAVHPEPLAVLRL